MARQLLTARAEMTCDDVILEHLVSPVIQVVAIRQHVFVAVDYVRDCGVVDIARYLDEPRSALASRAARKHSPDQELDSPRAVDDAADAL